MNLFTRFTETVFLKTDSDLQKKVDVLTRLQAQYPANEKIKRDLTLYKLCKIDPNFDVRNLSKKRSKLLEKSIKYADESIKGSILEAVKNPKYTKNLAMTKFVTSTALAIVSYIGLTKYRHLQTKKAAEKVEA